ncbi:MAG: AAA family ATPase [Gammaproteobacteria bacterium]
MSDIVTRWLDKLGLADYASVFSANDIDADVLPELTDADLKELGVTLGHRKKLLKAIAALDSKDPPETPPAYRPEVRSTRAPAEVTDAQRRQLTVMVCDLVGSTELSQQLDPEDLRTMNLAYQDACKLAIERYEGYVARYMGDGILAYFGYPRAHEDDAERAVHAGLALLQAMDELSEQFADQNDFKFAIRVGIATGPVVVGDLIGEGASQESAVVGETPNLAARLQGLAAPNSVLIAPETYKLSGALFAYEDIGQHELKGIAAPVNAYRVMYAADGKSRFEAVRTGELTPLVGRDEEFELLLRRWDRAKQGEGRVVLISGEPGIGKSRLALALRERLRGESHISWHYQCSPYHANSALYPVIHQLERLARLQRDYAPAEKLDKLESLLAQSSRDLSQDAALIAALLSIPTEQRYPPLDFTPEQQKDRTLNALVDQLKTLAAGKPVLLVVEDLHWIDPTTEELLGLIIEQIDRHRVMVLLTFRPEYESRWAGEAYATTLSLGKLGHEQCASLVEKVTGGKALPNQIYQQILEKTNGVPLFVEELTKTILESGLLNEQGEHFALTGPLPPLAIPATLHDSLMARLDRLAPVKEVAQTGAVIGREFSYALLAEVSPLRAGGLTQALDQIVESGMLFRRGTPPEATYTFKHALIQETAYQNLLRSTRQHVHAQIAKALQDHFPEKTQTEPEVVAHHLTEAGLVESAIGYWQKAGERAVQRSANEEATHHYSQALQGLATLPDTAENRQWETGLQLALGSVHIASKGWAAPDTEQAFARAHELCEQLGDSPALFGALCGLADVYFVSGRLNSALEIAERCLAIAKQCGGSAEQLKAHTLRGFVLFSFGDVVQARGHFEQALALYDRKQHDELKFSYGYDPQVDTMGWLSWTLALLGFPEQALEKSREALSLGQSLGHPHTLALAYQFATLVHATRREPDRAMPLALSMRDIGNEHGFPLMVAGGAVLHGWALSRNDDKAKGVEHLRHGVAAWQATGSETGLTIWLTLLAEAIADHGNLREALELLDDALALVAENRQRLFEPEIYRVKGEVLLKNEGSESEVEACFQKAVHLSAERQLRLLELRATVSLCRLWRQQREKKKPRERLTAIYGWFTEGFGAPDLRDAKQLLDDLNGSVLSNSP